LRVPHGCEEPHRCAQKEPGRQFVIISHPIQEGAPRLKQRRIELTLWASAVCECGPTAGPRAPKCLGSRELTMIKVFVLSRTVRIASTCLARSQLWQPSSCCFIGGAA